MVVLGEQVRIELFAEVAVVVLCRRCIYCRRTTRSGCVRSVRRRARSACGRERKSVDDLVFDRSAEFVAVAFDDGAFAVEQPVGVAVGLVGGSHPVLDVGVELAVVGLEVAFVAVPVAAAREGVGADERVENETAGGWFEMCWFTYLALKSTLMWSLKRSKPTLALSVCCE